MPRTKTLSVRAAHEDRPCPKMRTRAGPIDKETGRDKSMIYADQPVEVPNVRYYRRRIIKGDLVEVREAASVPVPTKSRKPSKSKSDAEE